MNESLKKKLGQMFCFGILGETITEEEKSVMQRYAIGNFILFSSNIVSVDQLCKLNSDLRKLTFAQSGEYPFLSLDQEGGWVTRLYEGAALMPGAMSLAAGAPDRIGAVGEYMGKILRATGCNMNYAPILDVNVDPRNPIIGSRAYGDDPETVAKLGVAMAKGLERAGVIACVKHFPGHGNVSVDSHLSLPENDTDLETLEKTDLLPFQRAVQAGVGSVMSAHIKFTKISNQPATMSHEVITGILRQKMGFEGLVTTDSMRMHAISKTCGVGEGAVRAIEAGIDIVLLPGTIEEQHECMAAVYAAVESGRITPERIEESYQRICGYKKKFDLAAAEPDFALACKLIENESVIAENKANMYHAITVLKNSDLLNRLSQGRVKCFAPISVTLRGVEEARSGVLSFADAFAARFENAEAVKISLDGLTPEVKAELDGEYDLAVVGVFNARLKPAQLEVFRAIRATGKPVVAVLLQTPYDAEFVKDADAIICSYEYTLLGVPALVQAMKNCDYQGKLPVVLPE